jgi:hypothetical protein
MIRDRHRWSGWPGAYCQECGVEDAAENALGQNWITFESDDSITWKDPLLREYVTYLNTHCLADATPEEIEQYKKEVAALEETIKKAGFKI